MCEMPDQVGHDILGFSSDKLLFCGLRIENDFYFCCVNAGQASSWPNGMVKSTGTDDVKVLFLLIKSEGGY